MVGFGFGDGGDVEAGARGQVAAHGFDVAEALEDRIRDQDSGERGELTQVLDGVAVEVDLVGNAVPHVSGCPPGHALDVEIVEYVDVVGGAVAAAGAAAEGEGGHHVVVDAAQRADGAGGVDDDAAGVHGIAELADDGFVGGEHDGGVAASAGVVHVEADFEGLIGRMGAVDRKHGEELLDGERMAWAHALDGSYQDFGAGWNGEADGAGNGGGALPDGHGAGESGGGVDDGASEEGGFGGGADVGASSTNFRRARS